MLSLSKARPVARECITLVIKAGRVLPASLREGGVHPACSACRSPRPRAASHTSTATVAVLPEADDIEVQIEDKDLEISIAASGGPGGQGVNTTNSAVQIIHKPTGLLVKCQDERSQLKNKAKALKVLKSRLLDREREKQEASVAASRKSMVSDRGALAEDSHLQFPAEPSHRSPDSPHAGQARSHHRRGSRRDHQLAAHELPGRAAAGRRA